jgi:hypothetical protein
MEYDFHDIELRVASKRFGSWGHFESETPEYSIALECVDDIPGHRGHHVHFDHHFGVVREVTMSAAMQAYIAVRQGRLMERWLPRQHPVPVYVWNADQDVCLAAFVLEHHKLLERSESSPLLRWIVQYNNKIDVCGGLYPVNLDELVKNHFTWVFEPYRQQRMEGKRHGDGKLVCDTIREVCSRLLALLEGRAETSPITAKPEILYASPYNFVIADEHGDPNSRLVLASEGHTNLISLICTRPNGRRTYSIIRGSPFDEDVFQIPRLIDAFQAAEDQPHVKIWGGSNLAAGSDSELGSSLSWEQIKDIAEPIICESARVAYGPHQMPQRRPMLPTALVVMSLEQRAQLVKVLSEAGIESFVVPSCAEARKVLDLEFQVGVVFTAGRLPDGGYKCVLDMARRHTPPLPVVVCVPSAASVRPEIESTLATWVLPDGHTSQGVREILQQIGVSHLPPER